MLWKHVAVLFGECIDAIVLSLLLACPAREAAMPEHDLSGLHWAMGQDVAAQPLEFCTSSGLAL